MNILVTNDDGLHCAGIRVLAEAASKFGRVVVSAPDRERSACGHAMTMRDPLRVKQAEFHGFEAYEVNGLPVDCVNVALTEFFPNGCDLVLSGINNGPNLGFDITYSGTAGGAMEGTINGINSIAFSMALFVDGAPIHYETAGQWLDENLEMLLKLPFPGLTFYNVNIPSIAFEELKQPVFVRMGARIYQDRVERRSDPWGRPYYWQGGVVVMDPTDEGTDVWAVSRGNVSITPVSLDWTNWKLLESLQNK